MKENKQFVLLEAIPFCTDLNIQQHNKKYPNSLQWFDSISKERMEQYATLDDKLSKANMFYMDINYYSYAIVIKYNNGHKLYLTEAQDNPFWLNVYSMNYENVETQKQKIIVKR